MRILTIEFGESDFFDACDGYAHGDGGFRDAAGWSEDCDPGGDGGGVPSPKTQTFLLTVTGPAGFAIAVTATPNATVAGQNVTWNGTLTAVNGYSGSVTLTCAAGAPGTCGIVPSTVTPRVWGNWVHGDTGQCDNWSVQFHDSGNGRNAAHATPAEIADGGDGRYLNRHGELIGDGSGGAERDLYILGGARGRDGVQLGGESCVLEPSGAH